MAENTTDTSALSFGSLLTVLFIGLKLTHYIDWPWIWVVSPMWIGLLILVIVLLLLYMIKGFFA